MNEVLEQHDFECPVLGETALIQIVPLRTRKFEYDRGLVMVMRTKPVMTCTKVERCGIIENNDARWNLCPATQIYPSANAA